jgi:dolichol-phosphate mannosyltransferase
MNSHKLDIIIPIYNEELCIEQLHKRFVDCFKDWEQKEIRYLYVDDGSTDKSCQLLKNLVKNNCNVELIILNKNCGHQNAITAGLHYSSAEYVSIIDADLQDPPELIIDLYNKALTGYEVVYAKRNTRRGEKYLKKITAKYFYKILNLISEENFPEDVGDFRVLSKKVVEALNMMNEKNRYIRGMIPWLGFKHAYIEYDRDERYAGSTKFSIIKMIKFSKDAIFSFSYFPVKLSYFISFIVFTMAFFGIILVLYLRLFTNFTVPGISTLIILILFLGSLQFFVLGLYGEYLSRVYDEVRKRPLYLIKEIIKNN